MSSVISIGLGQAGISIQEQQWDILLAEQGLDNDGVSNKIVDFQQRLDVYFKEVKQGIFRPRSVLVDVDSSCIDRVENGKLKTLHQGNSMIRSSQGSQNMFANVISNCQELKFQMLDAIRHETEMTDKIDSFQVQLSTCGGSGSGLSSILLGALREEYCCNTVNMLTLLPGQGNNDSTSLLEIYNTVLALNGMINYADIVLPFHNGQIQQILSNGICLSACNNFDFINAIAAQVHPAMTSGLRYPGQINASSLKILTNIIPFPRIKFMTCSLLPLNCYQTTTLNSRLEEYPNMIADSFNAKYQLLQRKDVYARIMASHSIIRGASQSQAEVEETFAQIYTNCQSQKSKMNTTYWIPNTFSLSYCDRPLSYAPRSLTTLANSFSIGILMKEYLDKYQALKFKKAFMHHYFQAGMDEMEFAEAESNLWDLTSEYQQGTTADFGDYEEEGYYDEEEQF